MGTDLTGAYVRHPSPGVDVGPGEILVMMSRATAVSAKADFPDA
jgi:hypothetical protein